MNKCRKYLTGIIGMIMLALSCNANAYYTTGPVDYVYYDQTLGILYTVIAGSQYCAISGPNPKIIEIWNAMLSAAKSGDKDVYFSCGVEVRVL